MLLEQNIKDKNHFLYLAKKENHKYYHDFVKAIGNLKSILKDKDYEDLLKNKLLFNQTFNENFYLQLAVETTVNSYFAKHFKDNFKYEVKSKSTNENIDCQINASGYTYNIEIKCPSIVKKKDYIRATSMRNNNREKVDNKMKEIGNLIGKDVLYPWDKGGANLKDQNLANYLKATQSKVGIKNNPKVINILVVSLYDSYSFSTWTNYLFADQGLFRKNSFEDFTLYNEVDFIVFTGVINSHKNWKNSKINAWDFNEHFNLIFKNPYSNKNKESGLYEFYNNFMCHHYTEEYNNFYCSKIKKCQKRKETSINNFILTTIFKKKNLSLVLNDGFVKNLYLDDYNYYYTSIKKYRPDSSNQIDILYLSEFLTLPREFYISLKKELFIKEEEYTYLKES